PKNVRLFDIQNRGINIKTRGQRMRAFNLSIHIQAQSFRWFGSHEKLICSRKIIRNSNKLLSRIPRCSRVRDLLFRSAAANARTKTSESPAETIVPQQSSTRYK